MKSMRGPWKALLKRWIEGSFPLDADVSRVRTHPEERLVGILFDGRDFDPGARWEPRERARWGRDANAEERTERAAWFPPPAA
jgi:hypothetical protein